jgi:hypothetical protein
MYVCIYGILNDVINPNSVVYSDKHNELEGMWKKHLWFN